MSQPRNLLSVERLSKRYGDRLLFDDITFGLAAGQKAALVARNGAGKSTLLQAICQIEPADSGRISFDGDVQWSLLTQNPGLAPEQTILENLQSAGNPAVAAIQQYEVAMNRPGDDEALSQATDAMDRTGAWDYEARMREVLGKLNIHDLDRKTGLLSGGEQRRIALARVLIEEPDLLFLDEPTNHLDLEMIAWLEKRLAASRTTLLMVTHDRYFLENVCDTIYELDDCTLYRYKGNYSYFLEKKAERQQNAMAARDRARRTMKRELEWMRSTPAARTGKSKSRIDRFYEIKAKARVKLEEDPMHIALNPERLGGKIIELHKISHGFGDRILFQGLQHHFKRNERIGIVGANGTGKSTLLDLIVGDSAPNAGKVVIGETVVFGHYNQHGAQFPDELKVIDAVREIAEFMPLKGGAKITAAQLLERFLFPRDMHHFFIRLLSGGEKKRLHLLQILMRNPNVLILDEPTNDLDIFTLQVLEEFLMDFPGCLIIVSHDRYFMDKLVEHVWVLGEEGRTQIRFYPGNYTQYRISRAEDLAEAKAKEVETQTDQTKPASSVDIRNDYSERLSFNERFEFDSLGKRIPQLELKKANLNDALIEATDHAEITRLAEELGQISKELDEAELRWLELSERA